MKFKILTKDQIIISLDRLTRFKPTKEKYLRVFSDILLSCLIEPKLKKSDIEIMDFKILTEMASEIFNKSIICLNHDVLQQENITPSLDGEDWGGVTLDQSNINSMIKQIENNTFINDMQTQHFLNNNINYKESIKLISADCPVNLMWLKMLSEIKNETCLQTLRQDNFLKYPLQKLILVEGITEEILLPAFSRFLGHDFYANGVQIIAAGGKNQVVKMYYKLSQEVKLPMFVLLDRDAEENIRQIEPRLREQDKIHLVSCGEFEDLLPKSLIVKTVNAHFKNFLSITESDLCEELPTAKILENLFKTKGLHEFKKAVFAKLVRENITDLSDISNEISEIVSEILV